MRVFPNRCEAISPRDKHPAIFPMFDGLASQEVMVLINDHDPKPLFYQFQMLYTKETEGGIQMNQGAHFCGSMMFGSADRVTLCEPLAKLKREHGPLREQMDAIAREAAEIGTDQDKNDWRQQLAKLKKRTEHFIGELDPHSEREEETLFPLLAKYIGREVGPIAVMEYEHELAKHHLSTFMEAMDQEKGAVDATRAKEIASYLLQAHSVLTDHFMKEENVLFPMAENMLNAEEKEELDRAFGLS